MWKSHPGSDPPTPPFLFATQTSTLIIFFVSPVHNSVIYQCVLGVTTNHRKEMLDQSLIFMDLEDEISFQSGKIKLSKLHRGFTGHSCVDRDLDSYEHYMFSFRDHSDSYSSVWPWRRQLLVADSSPGFGHAPADRSSVPQWLALTHLTTMLGSAAQDVV